MQQMAKTITKQKQQMTKQQLLTRKEQKRREYDERHGWYDDNEDADGEEKEVKGQHCTSTCQYAHKIKCVCGCGGVNHGIKSMVKMDAFFDSMEAVVQ